MGEWAKKEVEYLYSRNFRDVVLQFPPLLREFYVKSVSLRPLKLGLGEKLRINKNYEIDINQRNRLLKKFKDLVVNQPQIIYKIIEDYEKEKKKFIKNPSFNGLIELFAFQLRWYYPYELLEDLIDRVYNEGEKYHVLSILMTPSIPPSYLLETGFNDIRIDFENLNILKRSIKKEIYNKEKTLLSLALVDGIIFTVEQNEELRYLRYNFFKENYPELLKYINW